MTQEFVKKLMFPLIPAVPQGSQAPGSGSGNERGGIKSHSSCPRGTGDWLLPLPGLGPPWGRGGRQKLWALFLTLSMCLTPIIVVYGTPTISNVYSLTLFCRWVAETRLPSVSHPETLLQVTDNNKFEKMENRTFPWIILRAEHARSVHPTNK